MQRRNFIKATSLFTTGLAAFSATSPVLANGFSPAGDYVIGPLEGYSPQIGTLVSMLNYNRGTIINLTSSFTMKDLDYLFDGKANTIGALLMHLGAVDKVYQLNSFEGKGDFDDADKKLWGPALELGDEGRKKIKGKELAYYIGLITEVREKTLAELKKKDDAWLLAIDPKFGDGKEKFNTYWKWFHVCEHESNHRGQIAWLKSRLPGAKVGGE
jgi:uncharacterized damage-inducible protein DinB